jgi:hypothetical protein
LVLIDAGTFLMNGIYSETVSINAGITFAVASGPHKTLCDHTHCAGVIFVSACLVGFVRMPWLRSGNEEDDADSAKPLLETFR